MIASYPRAVSLGIRLPDSIVDRLPDRADRAVAVSYRHQSYTVINQRLDIAASIIGGCLQHGGYKAYPVPAAKRVSDEKICAVFSHKMAARLAGLGWIGKSCLLITPQAGPRVRWTSILTNAPLPAGGRTLEQQCGDCRECVDICPVGAFTGEPFRPHEPRETRYDAFRCDNYFETMKAGDPETAVCGLCLYVCPWGRNRTH